MSGKPERMDQETTKAAGVFLFKLPADEDEALDMRTRVKSDKTMRLLLWYSTIGHVFNSENALKISSGVKRLLISQDGEGRREAVDTLKQNFPKRVEIEKGFETLDDP